jgi:hypothetical protein
VVEEEMEKEQLCDDGKDEAAQSNEIVSSI